MVFTSQTFEILTERHTQWLFAKALLTTVELFITSGVVAFLLGSALAVLRLFGRTGSFLVSGFVEYHRNVPIIVQILVWYFGVPQIFPAQWQDWTNDHLGGFFFAVVALSLNAAAYISEDLRSGFRAVPNGQMEAGQALGMSYLQTMRLVLMPQAIRAALPALVNQSLSLFKSTSLAMVIGVGELMYIALQIDGETYATFAAFLVPTIFYLVCTLALMFFGAWLQRRGTARVLRAR